MEELLLFERDPDLLAGTPSGQPENALRSYRTEARLLPAGEWKNPYRDQERDAFGLILVDGLMSRRVALGNRQSVELLGPGDVLLPWVEDEGATLQTNAVWHVHDEATIAVLPTTFPRAMALSPSVIQVITERLILRSRWLAVDLTISHGRGVEDRLLLMLWHLADRWGRVTPDGVRVRLPLTHELLGEAIGCRRPSVTTALGQLGDRGVVVPVKEGGWLLIGPPPDPSRL